MEVNPIREIRAIGAASTPKAESRVQPPFAFDPAARMEDDAYRGNDREPGRGLEEEETEVEDEDGSGSSEGGVDVVA